MKLTPLLLVLRLRRSGSIPLLLLYTFMPWTEATSSLRFWIVKPYSFVEVYQPFEGPVCLNLP